MGSYYLTALAIVIAMPLAAIAVAAGLVRWARDAVLRAPVLGALGVIFTGFALVHLFVARACGDGVNRPIVAIVLADDACRELGLVSLQLVLLLVVATAAVVRLGDVRR